MPMQNQNFLSSQKPSQQQSQINLIGSNPTSMSHQLSNSSIFYESKRIPLRLCFIFRRSSLATDILVSSFRRAAPLLTNGTNGSVIDLVLPHTRTSHSIRFVDDMYARRWFYILHSKVSRCLSKLVPEIEKLLYVARDTCQIKALGWLAEQVNNDEITTIKSWQPVFLILTDSEICFFPCSLISKQMCRELSIVYPILSSR